MIISERVLAVHILQTMETLSIGLSKKNVSEHTGWTMDDAAVCLTLGGMFFFVVLLFVMHEGTHRHKRFTSSRIETQLGEERLQSRVGNAAPLMSMIV